MTTAARQMRMCPAALAALLLCCVAPIVAREDASSWVLANPAGTEILHCAKFSEQVTFVERSRAGTVIVRSQTGADSSRQITRGPELPFDPGPAFHDDAYWTSLALQHGWIVGRDQGEWGGALWRLMPGSAPEQLLDGNVWAVGRYGNGFYAVIDGGPSEASSALVAFESSGAGRWDSRLSFALPGVPLAVAADQPHWIYVLTDRALLLLRDNRLETLSELAIPDLPPFSMAIDETGVYVGMKLLWFHRARRCDSMVHAASVSVLTAAHVIEIAVWAAFLGIAGVPAENLSAFENNDDYSAMEFGLGTAITF